VVRRLTKRWRNGSLPAVATPELKRNCVTMPDGTDWRDLPALIQFAHGVEARTIAATENHPSQPKRPRLAHATCDVAATQASQSRNKPRPQTRGKENAGPSGVATAPPAAVPGRFHGLWRHSLAKGWRDVGGRPYKEDGVRWMEVVNARECLNCHRSLATPSAEGGCACERATRKRKGGGGERVGKRSA
jgi:hypothetical protein